MTNAKGGIVVFLVAGVLFSCAVVAGAACIRWDPGSTSLLQYSRGGVSITVNPPPIEFSGHEVSWIADICLGETADGRKITLSMGVASQTYDEFTRTEDHGESSKVTKLVESNDGQIGKSRTRFRVRELIGLKPRVFTIGEVVDCGDYVCKFACSLREAEMDRLLPVVKQCLSTVKTSK